MSCEITPDELAALAAGDLSPEESRRIGAHVDECAECRRRLDALRRADRALAVLPRLEPPTDAVLAARRALSRELRGAGGLDLLTLEEVAELLRVPATALGEVARSLPAFEVGGQVRVRREKLIEWIEERERAYARGRIESEVAALMARMT